MSSNSRQAATRQYVDQSVDAQRHYVDTLFRDAERRMGFFLAAYQAEQNRLAEKRLQEALATIRPPPTVYPPPSRPDAPEGWTQLTITRQDGRLRIRLR